MVFRLFLFACLVAAGLFTAACSSSSALPTAPTPTAVSSASVNDPRFDRAFYEAFALAGGAGYGRRPASMTVYVNNVDDKKNAVPADTIQRAMTAAASLQEAMGLPIDVRPRAGSELREVLKGVSVMFLASPDDGR